MWWWALTFDETSASLQWSRDEFPPAPIRALIEANGLDLDLPHNWVLQRKAFDRRPADRLPQWWIEKLESVGAWDPVKKELAVDEDANPLYGPKLFGGDPDDEFYPNDDDEQPAPRSS